MVRSWLRTALATALAVGLLMSMAAGSVVAAPPSPSTLLAAPAAAAPPVPPVSAPAYPVYHVVQWGETLSQIARRYGTTVWAIAQANGIWNVDYIRAGQLLLIPGYAPAPAPWPGTYIVQRGDTLTAIAWRFGTTVWAIAQANGIWNPNFIYVGQRLLIP